MENENGERIGKLTDYFYPRSNVLNRAIKVRLGRNSLPDIAKLPKIEKSVFYFNPREIPPRSSFQCTANCITNADQIILSSCINLCLANGFNQSSARKQITLTKKGDRFE